MNRIGYSFPISLFDRPGFAFEEAIKFNIGFTLNPSLNKDIHLKSVYTPDFF